MRERLAFTDLEASEFSRQLTASAEVRVDNNGFLDQVVGVAVAVAVVVEVAVTVAVRVEVAVVVAVAV